jgi:AraC-like DNA-binding protein
MQVTPFHIPKASSSTVIYQEDKQHLLYESLHSHPETQITLIVEKGGSVYIGGFLEEFSEGDIYIIRGEVPHVFKSDIHSKKEAYAISVFFDQQQLSLLGGFNEMNAVPEFFKLCGKGAKIIGASKRKVADFILAMRNDGDFQRLIKLIVLIKMVYETKDYQSFDQLTPSKLNYKLEGERMTNILDFTFHNYSSPISIDAVADVANMTSQAFCRYFKKHTRKSYINFLNEVRVNAAKQLLNDSSKSIAEISAEVGFNNLSNFNRFFKKITATTPSKYRKQIEIHKA